MWILLDRIILMLILFFSLSFGEDFERICNEEVLKEDFNITVVEDTCKKAGDRAIKNKKIDDASWFYLLNNNLNLYIDKEDENSSFIFYTNLGHAYVLKNDFINAKIAYDNVLTFDIDLNSDIEKDYKLLHKLFPQKKTALEKGLKLWNQRNQLFTKILTLSKEYEELYDNREYNLMIEKIKEIIKMKNQTILKNQSSTMLDYYNLAYIYEERKLYFNAIKNYQFALNIAQKILEKDHTYIGTIYNSLGLVFQELKEYQKAEDSYLLALEIYKKHFKKDDNQFAIIYNNIASNYGDKQNYKKALEYYQKSLNIEEKHPTIKIIQTYYNIGLLYQQMKEYQNVLDSYKKVLPFIKNSPLEMATYYTLLGAYYQEVEKNEDALYYYRKSLEIREKELGEKHSDTAETYNSLGSIYEALKDFNQALLFYKKALAINLVELDKNDIFIAISYNNIASIYVELEEYNKAKKYLLKTLEIKNTILKKNDIDFAVTYTNLGFIEEKLKNYKIASEYYDKALLIYFHVNGKKSIEVAILYNHIASLYKAKKNYYLSIEYLKNAKNIMEKILDKNHTHKSLIYNNLGLLYNYVKEYREAYRYNALSFQIFLNNRNKNFKILDSKQKGFYIQSFGNRIDNLYDSAYKYIKNNHPKSSKVSKNIFTSWLYYKGTLFEYQNILSMVKNNPKTPKHIIASIDKLNHLNSQLSGTKNISKEENLTKQIHTIEIELSKENDSLKSILNISEINSTQIANYLQPHQLYIDFARGNDNYYIFTIDNNNSITFQQIDDNRTKLIDRNIRAYRENTKNMAEKIAEKKITEEYREESTQEAKTILNKLYHEIIEEYLDDIIKDKTHLVLSPDGLLNYLPFEALYNKNSYLIENYSINYISSGKEFIRQTKLTKKDPKHEMILFANANFNTTVKAYNPFYQEQTLAPRYAKTNTEKKIEKRFNNLGDIEIKVIKEHYGNPLIFKEENATVKNLMMVESSKILHLSTHGYISKDEKIINPMRKAILVFAGANKNIKNASISALKLSALDLKDTELVVLSACQSGLGDIQSAEGVVGLPKALLQAGAKNVLMSLWTVSNKKTAMLMDCFYDNISKKQNYNQALQNAKIKMIKYHPYYWSAFILSGL